MSLEKQGCQYFSRWGRCAVVWDDIGTCRAMDKHGASTVVSGGDGIRKLEHVTTMNSILNGMQRIRTVSLLYDGLVLVGKNEYFSKITINAKEPPRGSHSTATRVFVHQSGRQIENRERRRREREILTFLRWFLGNFVSKNGEKLKFLLKYICNEIGAPYILKKYFITKSGFRKF